MRPVFFNIKVQVFSTCPEKNSNREIQAGEPGNNNNNNNNKDIAAVVQ